MLRFEGEYTIPHPVPHVAAQLSDAEFLLGCLKDVDSIIEANRDRAVWKLKPAFSFVSGTLEVSLQVMERSETQTKYEITSKGVGMGSIVESLLQFQAVEVGTRVQWQAEITALTGLMKLAPKALVQAAAGKVIQDTWAGIAAKLSE